MQILFLQSPSQLASVQSQTNDLVIDRFVKTVEGDFAIVLFGPLKQTQKYISAVYTLVWDYCLLYSKIAYQCTVYPVLDPLVWQCPSLGTNCSISVPLGFPASILDKINETRTQSDQTPLEWVKISHPVFTDEIIPLDIDTASVYHVKIACVGGTFDCLHPGHRILLTLASLLCDKLIIGLTTDTMLQKKEGHEKIKPYAEREAVVLSFLHTVKPSLEVVVNPLKDIYGPSVLEPDIEAIIVSLETLSGAEMINSVRKEKGMDRLKVFTVNRSCKYNLSSTFIRQHFES